MLGEVIRQNPIRIHAVFLIFLGTLTLLIVKGGARFVGDVDAGTENLLAVGAAAVVVALLALRLRLRFPTFTIAPSDLQAIERSGKVYRIRLASGETKRVLLTGSPEREGTAHQLLRVLPSSMLSSASVSTAATGASLAGATGSWQPLDRRQVFAELRAITEGTPAPEADPGQATAAETGPPPSITTMTAPSTGAPSPTDRGPSIPAAAANTAGYLRERDYPGGTEPPTREQVAQWERDDEYAKDVLRQHNVRGGSLVGLRLLTWALMFVSMYFLASDDAGMETVFALWAAALIVGLVRGLLMDARAKRTREIAFEAARKNPHFTSRGMPAPWVKAARYTPSGTAKMSRAALRLLFVFFLIGLSALWEDSNLPGTIIIAIILAVIAGVWGWLSYVIRRREKRNREAANALAGPRLYWIDHPEHLGRIADDYVGSE